MACWHNQWWRVERGFCVQVTDLGSVYRTQIWVLCTGHRSGFCVQVTDLGSVYRLDLGSVYRLQIWVLCTGYRSGFCVQVTDLTTERSPCACFAMLVTDLVTTTKLSWFNSAIIADLLATAVPWLLSALVAAKTDSLVKSAMVTFRSCGSRQIIPQSGSAMVTDLWQQKSGSLVKFCHG